MRGCQSHDEERAKSQRGKSKRSYGSRDDETFYVSFSLTEMTAIAYSKLALP
jgi:hypothetical protein